MPYSTVTYTGNGSKDDYTITFPYLQASHIKAYLDGVATTDFTIPSSDTVLFDSAPGDGVTIEIKRDSSRNAVLVDFTNGSALTEADLDTAVTQGIYIAQEAFDEVAAKLGLDGTDNWDADSKRLKDLSDPTSDQDAATKAYVDTKTASDVVAAQAAQAAAEAAQSAAEGAQADAESAESTATTASSNASAAQTAAEAAQSAAEAAAASLSGGTVPDGGSSNEVLRKASGDDQDIEWAALSVDTAEIVDDAVTTAKLVDDAVTADKIADDAVTTARIADDAVTTAKLASGNEYDDGVFTGSIRTPGVTLTYGAAVTPDMDEGAYRFLTLTGDCQLNLPTNIEDGKSLTIVVMNDDTGNHLLTFDGAWIFVDQTPPEHGADAYSITILHMIGFGTTKVICGANPGFLE